MAADFLLRKDGGERKSNLKTLRLGPLTKRGFYLAFQAQGACMGLQSVRVFFKKCSALTRTFVHFPDTVPHSLVQQAQGQCVDDAIQQGATLHMFCGEDGQWVGQPSGACACRAGFEPLDAESRCQGEEVGGDQGRGGSLCGREWNGLEWGSPNTGRDTAPSTQAQAVAGTGPLSHSIKGKIHKQTPREMSRGGGCLQRMQRLIPAAERHDGVRPFGTRGLSAFALLPVPALTPCVESPSLTVKHGKQTPRPALHRLHTMTSRSKPHIKASFSAAGSDLYHIPVSAAVRESLHARALGGGSAWDTLPPGISLLPHSLSSPTFYSCR